MPELVLTFLGTGTSIGIPVIGCECEVCRSEDPRDKRLRSSIHVHTAEADWVVDTGPDFRTQCLRAGIRHLDAVIYTHAHMDHVTGFDDLRRFSIGADEVLPLYAEKATLADLKRMFAFAFSGENRYPGYIKPEPYEIKGPFVLGNTRILPLPVRHGKVETTGFLFEREGRKLVAYVPDCKEFSPEALAALEGTDTLILDALRRTPHPTHMNFTEALAIVERINPRAAWFTHMSDEILHARDEAALPPPVKIAYDGLQLEW